LTTLNLLSADGRFLSQARRQHPPFDHGVGGGRQSGWHSFTITGVCGMFGLYFTREPTITTYQQAIACDVERFRAFSTACSRLAFISRPRLSKRDLCQLRTPKSISKQPSSRPAGVLTIGINMSPPCANNFYLHGTFYAAPRFITTALAQWPFKWGDSSSVYRGNFAMNDRGAGPHNSNEPSTGERLRVLVVEDEALVSLFSKIY